MGRRGFSRHLRTLRPLAQPATGAALQFGDARARAFGPSALTCSGKPSGGLAMRGADVIHELVGHRAITMTLRGVRAQTIFSKR